MRFILFLAILFGAAAPARADMSAHYRHVTGATMTIEVADDGDARLELSGKIWHMVVAGGEAYIVYRLPAGTRVARIADLERIMEERGRGFRPPPGMLEGFRLIERGQVTIAGHSGRAFYLRNARVTLPTPSLVISSDPALAALGTLLGRQLDFSIATIRIGGGEPSANLLLIRRLLAEGAPLLFGGLRLQAIERAPIERERLRLPALPQTIEELRAGGVPQIA